MDPFLGILAAMVFISEVKLRRLVGQFQASLTKPSALLQVVVQFGKLCRHFNWMFQWSSDEAFSWNEGIQKGSIA